MVFLIGFMGCGKTYWGNRLAAKTGIPVYDLDALIEAHEERPVQQVFAQNGEAEFRKIERDCLRDCRRFGKALIATGGGTPCFFDNMAWMNRHGLTIYLDTPAAILADRLKHQRSFRPLLAGVEEHILEAHIEKLVLQRIPYYRQARITLVQSQENTPYFEQMLLEAISAEY